HRGGGLMPPPSTLVPFAVAGPAALKGVLLEKFEGREAISELFTFQLDIVAPNPLDFSAVLGQWVQLWILVTEGGSRQPVYRPVHGMVSRMSQGEQVSVGKPTGAKELPPWCRYRLEMVPQMWLLTRWVQSRIYQQLTVPDILEKVFDGYETLE